MVLRPFVTFLFVCVVAHAQVLSPVSMDTEVRRIVDSSLAEGTFSTREGLTVQTRVPVSAKNVEMIKRIGKAAIPTLSEYAKSSDSRTQRVAVEFLGQIGGPDIIPPLADVLMRSRSSANRLMVLGWLSQESPAVTRGIIEQVQNDTDLAVRSKARELLRKIEPPQK